MWTRGPALVGQEQGGRFRPQREEENLKCVLGIQMHLHLAQAAATVHAPRIKSCTKTKRYY